MVVVAVALLWLKAVEQIQKVWIVLYKRLEISSPID
jgi:hypothetical protein